MDGRLRTLQELSDNITGELTPARYVPSASIFAGNQDHIGLDVSPIAASTPSPIFSWRCSRFHERSENQLSAGVLRSNWNKLPTGRRRRINEGVLHSPPNLRGLPEDRRLVFIALGCAVFNLHSTHGPDWLAPHTPPIGTFEWALPTMCYLSATFSYGAGLGLGRP